MKVLREIPVGTGTSEVLLSLGYQRDKVPARIRSRVESLFAGLKRTAKASAVYQRTQLAVGHGRIVLDGKSRIESLVMRRVLKPCSGVVAFVVTLGADVDELIDELQRKSANEAFLGDAIASRMAEDAAESFQREVGKRLSGDEAMTLRYSPGYCDWPLSQQKMIFAIVDGRRIGVSLNDHCMMRPSKSVSGIFGVGRKDLVEDCKNACDVCRRKDCEYRRSS